MELHRTQMTEAEVREVLEGLDKDFTVFEEWMNGRPQPAMKGGFPGYHAYDVRAFLEL